MCISNIEEYAKEKYSLYQEITGLLIDRDGVMVVELLDCYSDYVYSYEELNKIVNNHSYQQLQLWNVSH